MFFWESDFFPGHPGIEEFVPGYLPGQQDSWTAGQGNVFNRGERDNGLSRPVETLLHTKEVQIVSF